MPPEKKRDELLRLRELLKASRLRPSEKSQILAQIEALDPKSKSPEPEYKPSPDTAFGLFDRPAPKPDVDDDKPAPAPSPQTSVAAAPKIASPALEELRAPESEPEPGPSATEIEELAAEIADVADRVIWLRSFWATTLSDDVAREESAWHKRLQLLATKLKAIAPDKLEEAVAGQSYLLSQPVREYRKPTMTQQVQERVMPASIPSSVNAAINDQFYKMLDRRPIAERKDPSYIPDGLQSFIA